MIQWSRRQRLLRMFCSVNAIEAGCEFGTLPGMVKVLILIKGPFVV